VRIDEVQALLALDRIYVDGAVALPIRLGLGLANLQKPSDLVARGLVNIDVVDGNGVALTGTVELATPGTGTPGQGSDAWLIWVGERPFLPNSSYELQYSFVNDKISACPEAVPALGSLAFSTGELSAAGELEGAMLNFTNASLHTQIGFDAGCCSAPDSGPCISAGKCVACWSAYSYVSGAQAALTLPLPASYFKIDFSLLAGNAPQTVVDHPIEGNALFLVQASAPDYCFVADLRPRAGLDAVVSARKCVPSRELLLGNASGPFTPLPASECSEPPASARAGANDVLHVVFGTTEEEARAGLNPAPTPPSGAGTPTPAPPPVITQTSSSNDCTFAAGHANTSVSMGLLALLLLALRGWRRQLVLRTASSARRLASAARTAARA
jgi:hypothetical protein